MIKTRGVAHFSIPVRDTARARDFYCQRLGMKLLADVASDGMVFLDSGGDCIILVRVDQPISTAGVRNVHHAFRVAHDDYEATLTELKASGVRVIYEEDRRHGVVNGPRAYFEDPDGNTLELIDLTSYKG
jgi:catechol 2,3-dioxygenase-like lactoylglutathione lyase family enzyme